MGLLYLMVHHGVHDADSAVDAEGKCHLLIHGVKVRIAYLVDEQAHADDASLFPDWEAENRSGDIEFAMSKYVVAVV